MLSFMNLIYLSTAANIIGQIPIINSLTLFNRGQAAGSLDDFIASEAPVAWQGVLNNVGSGGPYAVGVEPGLVVASPSRTDPDYYYSWTRDSALTTKALIESFINGNAGLRPHIEDYIYAQAQLQAVENPSGSLANGAGLGEPKFQVDGTAFTGSWGRPQRDGPALRATALIAYSRWLLGNGGNSTVTSLIWPIVSNDLNYIAQYWNQTTFDLWEETDGSSFFTTAAQHRALVEGNTLAGQIGETCSGCVSQAPQILCFLQGYWKNDYILASVNTDNGRSSKDVNTILASVHIFDPSAGCDNATFQPCSERALASHKVTTDAFRPIFAINSRVAEGTALAVGRYPEDVYQGGNPWYLTTLAAAEQLYDALHQWSNIGSLTVTPTSLPFFRDFSPSITPGTYTSTSPTYTALISAIKTYADGYMSVVQQYTPSNGSLAEQFSRHDGTPLSASCLTWSYTAFLTAVARRSGQMPASWGASASADTIPSTCSGTSAQGMYVTPTVTAPQPPCTTATSVSVVFNVAKETKPFVQDISLVGSIPQLGNWDPALAVGMSAVDYQSEYPRWFVSVELPAGLRFEYKFVMKESGGVVVWEGGVNRAFEVPKGCAKEVWLREVWQN